MEWKELITDYEDAKCTTGKKYKITKIEEDGSDIFSIKDVSIYDNEDISKTFFGAKDANMMNTALNAIMRALYKNNSSLCSIIMNYIEKQKETLNEYIIDEENRFNNFIKILMYEKQDMFNTWFENLKAPLDENCAAKLSNKIIYLEEFIKQVNEMFFNNKFDATLIIEDYEDDIEKNENVIQYTMLIIDDINNPMENPPFVLAADWRYKEA